MRGLPTLHSHNATRKTAFLHKLGNTYTHLVLWCRNNAPACAVLRLLYTGIHECTSLYTYAVYMFALPWYALHVHSTYCTPPIATEMKNTLKYLLDLLFHLVLQL